MFTPPEIVMEKGLAVALESVQNAPRSLDVKVGTVSKLNPVLVNRYTVENVLDVSVREVPDTLEVIQRVSVGRVNRMLEVASRITLEVEERYKLLSGSLLMVPNVFTAAGDVIGGAVRYGCPAGKLLTIPHFHARYPSICCRWVVLNPILYAMISEMLPFIPVTPSPRVPMKMLLPLS